MASSLEDLHVILKKFARVAAQIDAEGQEALLSMFQQALDHACEKFEIDPESLVPPPSASESYDHDLDAPAEADAEDPEDDDGSPFVVTRQFLDDFKIIEFYIAERVALQGKGALGLFARFDRTRSSGIAPLDFHSVISALGVSLTGKELRLLAYKYPCETCSIDGAIDYEAFVSACFALAATQRPSATPAQSAALNAHKTSPGPVVPATSDPFRRSIRLTPAQKLQAGLRAMRSQMYARSVSLPLLFRKLRSEKRVVSVASLVPEVISQGFPATLLTKAELEAEIKAFALADEDAETLTYTEFTRFFRGDSDPAAADDEEEEDPAAAAARATAKLMNDRDVINSFTRLNNIPLRAHFKGLDMDKDGQVSVADIVRDFCSMSISGDAKPTPELTALVSTFSVRNPGFLQFSEYVQFANARVKMPLREPAPEGLNVSIPPTATAIELVHILHSHVQQVSFDSLFERWSPVGSTMITEADLWHALEGAGFHASKETVGELFKLLDPVPSTTAAAAEGEESVKVINYKDLTVTIIYPGRNPRFGRSSSASDPFVGEDSVPLGSSIERLAKEFTVQSRPVSTAGKARLGHSHRFDEETVSAEESAASAAASAAGKITSTPRPSNKSSVVLADTQPGDVIPVFSLNPDGSTGSTAPPRKAQNSFTKGSIDFVSGHGPAEAPRQARSSAQLAHSHRFGEAADPVQPPPSRGDYVPSTVFSSSAGPEAPVRGIRSDPKARYSQVTFEDVDASGAHKPVKRLSAVPVTHSSVRLDHDTAEASAQAPVAAAEGSGCIVPQGKTEGPGVTGYACRRYSQQEGTFTLRHDATEASGVPPTRRHYDPNSAPGTIDHLGLGAQVADTPYIMRKQVRGGSAAAPAVEAAEPEAAETVAQELTFDDDADAQDGAPLNAALFEKLGAAVFGKGKTKDVFMQWSQGVNLVTKKNFADGASSLGFDLPKAQVEAAFKQFDKDNKGALSFGQFVRVMSVKA